MYCRLRGYLRLIIGCSSGARARFLPLAPLMRIGDRDGHAGGGGGAREAAQGSSQEEAGGAVAHERAAEHARPGRGVALQLPRRFRSGLQVRLFARDSSLIARSY